MCKRVLWVPLIALSFVFTSSAFAEPQDLASADWSAKSANSLAARPPSADVVKAFMNHVEYTLTGLSGPELDICFARFANLRRSGDLSLVVAENGGRPCDLSVVDKAGAAFRIYSFDAGVGFERPEIKDLAGDGGLGLVVPTDFTSYEGAPHCVAQFPVIYAWTGSTYSDVSGRYRKYYEEQLASLQKQIAETEAQNERAKQALAAQGTGSAGEAGGQGFGWHPQASAEGKGANAGKNSQPVAEEHGPGLSVEVFAPEGPPPQPQPPAPPEPDRAGLDCAKAEAAKVERFLGISRDAGMSDAIKWAESNNPLDREFAADVLADIGTPEAIEYLRTLSRDPNKEVASSAKSGLVQVAQGPVKHTVDVESIPDAAGKPSQ